jgi:hypothetical protein
LADRGDVAEPTVAKIVTVRYKASVRDRCSWVKALDPWTDIR